MTTYAELEAATRRHLYSGEVRDERDRLTSYESSGSTTIELDFARPGVQEGATLGIDREEMFVWSVSGSTATVSRGENGTTAAAHSAGAVVHVNPRFSGGAIFAALNAELASLISAGLYRVDVATFTYSLGTDMYNLELVSAYPEINTIWLDDIVDVLTVEASAEDGTGRWLSVPPTLWRLRRTLNATDFTNQTALTLNAGFAGGPTIRVTVKTPYIPLDGTESDVANDTGLHASAHDILPLGAAIRLGAGNEVSRHFLVQGDTRRADEIQAGARLGAIRNLMILRQQRIEQEKARLYQQFPRMR